MSIEELFRELRRLYDLLDQQCNTAITLLYFNGRPLTADKLRRRYRRASCMAQRYIDEMEAVWSNGNVSAKVMRQLLDEPMRVAVRKLAIHCPNRNNN